MADKLSKKYRLSKIFKRAMALFIIVIISFNSYAAVISSNDGSAFITKAEFDALVNDFNSRIEDYEKSIDAKIDGAIAEYLAGLATSSVVNLKSIIESLSEHNRTFSNAIWNNYNSSNIVAGDATIQVVYLNGFFLVPTVYPYDVYGKYIRFILVSGANVRDNYSGHANYGWWTPVKYDNDFGFYYVGSNYQMREIMHYRAAGGLISSNVYKSSDVRWDDTLDTTQSLFNCSNTDSGPLMKTFQLRHDSSNVSYFSSLTATYTNGTSTNNYVGNLNTQCFNKLSTSSYWFIDSDSLTLFDDARQLSFTTECERLNASLYRRDSSMNISETQSYGSNNFNTTIKSNSTKKIQMPLVSIKNHALSVLIGKSVNLYDGLPMCDLVGSPGKITFKLELSNEAIVCVNYGAFSNEALTTSTVCDKNYGVLSAGTHNLELDLKDDKWTGRKDILWLKVNRTSSSVNEIKVNVSDIYIEIEA